MLLTAALLAALGAAPATDSLQGTWQITGDVVGNPLKETCTLKQAGAALSGSCTNDQGGPYPVTGETKDGKLTFRHAGDYNGEALTIVFTVTAASAKELTGTVDVQPFNVSGTFTAAPAAPAASTPAKP